MRFTSWLLQLAPVTRVLSEIAEWKIRRDNIRYSATSIQRIFRGYVGRIKYIREKIKQVEWIRLRYRICRIMQRLWRGFM